VFTGGDDPKLVILDDKTLAKTGEVSVTGPIDDIHYDPENGLVYAAHDDGAEDWVIDPKTEKIVVTSPSPAPRRRPPATPRPTGCTRTSSPPTAWM